MGKGSIRRPTDVSEETFQENYDRTFGKRERRKVEFTPLRCGRCGRLIGVQEWDGKCKECEVRRVSI